MLIRLTAIMALLAAAVCSLRSSASALLLQQSSAESLQLAVSIDPGNPGVRKRLAAMLASRDRAAAATALTSAIELNPMDAELFVALGILREESGDAGGALRAYTRAVQTSRRYQPRLALSAFHFRQNDQEAFWRTAREAANIREADGSAIYAMAALREPDLTAIPARLGLRSQASLLRWARFALAYGLDEGATVLAGVSPERSTEELFVHAADRLLAAGHVRGALSVWNRLCGSGVRSCNTLHPETGESLSHPGFDSASGRAFDWRPHRVDGVQTRTAASVEVAFSGDQSEEFDVLEQHVPVLPGRTYRIRTLQAIANLTTHRGLDWRASQAGHVISMPVTESGEASGEFRTLPGTSVARFVLCYRRTPGTSRISGTLRLIAAEWRLIP